MNRRAKEASGDLEIKVLVPLLPGTGSGSARDYSEPEGIGADADSPEDGRWMGLVEECVEVIAELDDSMDDLDAPRRELAEHMVLRLQEILQRSGVEVISEEAAFDRSRHKPATESAADGAAAVSQTLSPGFAVGRRVLRRARVLLEDPTEKGGGS